MKIDPAAFTTQVRPPGNGAADDDEAGTTANPLNLRRALHGDDRTKDLVRFDSFGRRIMLERPIPRPDLPEPEESEPRPWRDEDDIALCEHLNRKGFKRVGKDLVRDVIALEASGRTYHPVRDYLDALTWDAVPRLSRFFFDHCGTIAEGESDEERREHNRYLEAVTRSFFVSAVARVYEPGCKCDSMLVLEGAQGALKSRLLRLLAVKDDWFSDSLPENLGSKDARAHLAGRWIVEMAEVAQFRRGEVETIKSFLSCQIDIYRPAYGRSDVSVPRQNVFIGSTNADTYLHDSTGNRRFWPIRVAAIHLETIRPIVDQLWAEATAVYHAGAPWWLASDLERIAAGVQHERLTRDPWQDVLAGLAERCPPGGELTTAECFINLGVDVGDRTRSDEMRVGGILRDLGLVRTRRRVGGGRAYVYVRPESASAAAPPE
jgi:putative DNA primase/helicase